MKRRTPATIAVVGASVAGLDVAAEAAQRGHSVTVYERSTSLDPADRTLIVTHRVEEFLGPILAKVTINEISRYELFANGSSCGIELARPDLVIERSTLIRLLARRARQAGAEIRLGSRFAGLSGDRAGIRLQIEGDETRVVDTVVAGDGVHSVVARAAGWPEAHTVPLVQAVVETPADLAPDTTRVWFRPDESPYFYWLIPQGPDRSVLGLIGEVPGRTRRSLELFLRELGLSAIEYQAARVPEYRRWIKPQRVVGGGRVILVGDAAGHVKVSTVGGIYTGFRGSRTVANGSRRELRQLRRELGRHRLVRRVLHNLDAREYAAVLASLGSRAQSAMARHTRDDSARLLWRLSWSQPRLVALGLRAVMTKRSQPKSDSQTGGTVGVATARS